MTSAPINHEKWVPQPKDIRGLIGAIAARCREAGCTYQALGEIKPTKVMWPYPTKLPSTLDGFCTHPRIAIPRKRLLDAATEAEHWYTKAREGVNDKLLNDVSVMVGKDISPAFTKDHCNENQFLVELILLLIPSCRSFTLDEKNFYIRVGSINKTDVIGFFDNKAFGRRVDIKELTKPLLETRLVEARGFGLMERLWLWVHANKVRDKSAVLAALASLKATDIADWAVLLDENTFGGLIFEPEADLQKIRKRLYARWKHTKHINFNKPITVDKLELEYTIDDYDKVRNIMRTPGTTVLEKFEDLYEYLVPSKLDDKRFRLIFGRLPTKTLTVLQEEKLWQCYVRFEKRMEQFLGITR